MKTRLKRLLSGILALAMVMAMMPTMAFAEENTHTENPCAIFYFNPLNGDSWEDFQSHTFAVGDVLEAGMQFISPGFPDDGSVFVDGSEFTVWSYLPYDVVIAKIEGRTIWLVKESAPTHEADTSTYGKDGTNHWNPCSVEGCTEHTYNETAHQLVEGACVCGVVCTHQWNSETGSCNVCGMECAHFSYNENYACANCGKPCTHPVYNMTTGACQTCHKPCTHSWNATTGKCDVCAMSCKHDFDADHICIICGAKARIYMEDDTLYVLADGVSPNDYGQFKNDIKHIVFTEGVSYIYYFGYMPNLETVTFSSTIRRIDRNAFSYCYKLKKVTLNEGLETIASNVFFNCTSLTDINFPSTLKTIEDYAFSYCSSLTDVTFPAALTSIGECAFQYCTSLKNVVFEHGVSVAGRAFGNCTGLESVTFCNDPAQTTTIQQGQPHFISCSSLKEVVLGASVKTIPGVMFIGCSNIEKLVIGNKDIVLKSNSFLDVGSQDKPATLILPKDWAGEVPVEGELWNSGWFVLPHTHTWKLSGGFYTYECSECHETCDHTAGVEDGKCKTCGVKCMATVDLLAKMDGADYVDAENGITMTVAKDASGNITGLAFGELGEISIQELGNLAVYDSFNEDFNADMYVTSIGFIFLVDENGNIPFAGSGDSGFVRTELVDSSLPLGDNLTVTIGENTFYFVPNADEADDDYEGLYRQVDATALDFDYYKWANDGDNLRATARKEMDESESATDLTIQTINGVAVATYVDQEEGYSTLTAIFDGGNYYAELVFYYADGTEKAQAQAIIDSVTGYQAVKAESFNMDCVELTTTGYYQGHDVDLDTANGQTGYYYNFTNDVDFDTYEWDVDVDDTNLQSAVINDINKSHAGQNVTPVYTTINGVPVAYYDAIDTVTEGEEQVQYKTRTYLLLVDGTFYEYVFYTENAADVKIAEGIMNTLAGVESEHSYEENGKHSWVNVDNAFSLNYEVACVKCGMKGTKKAVISKESSAGKTTYTATTPEGKTYTKTVVEKIGVTYQGETTQYDFATILTLTADTEVDWLANGVKVGAGSKTYTFAVTKDVEIATEEASEPEPIVRLNVDRSNAAKAVLSLEWTMPKGYTLVEAGIYRNLNMTETQLDATAPKVSALKTTNGTYELTVNLSAASRSKDVSAKGYIKYRTPSGETKTMQTAFQRVANQ